MTKYFYIIIMSAFVGLFFYFTIPSVNSSIEKINQCKEAGGVAIKDYKGAFGVCLNPSAVIKVE